MTTEAQRIADGSTLVGLVQAAVTQLRAWVAAAWLASTGTTITNGLAAATRTSTLTKAVRILTHFTRHSYLYRWLTKKPDPEVIVIDLRETYTVGPFIAFLDHLAPTVERTWRGSSFHRIFEQFRASSKRDWVTRSRTIRLLAAVLEPPEPPDETR